ncbi:aminoglycoside phosphotransferase family protein [Streptomyces sp. NPDC005318]|uniref:aminoglycoside phosphotransferase family protein n=1 Tax=Streptomyces sp. NPDC005318 TaxID=3157031 RepID=UPI0033B975E4
MDVTAPPATGVRHRWADLPDSVRSAVETILGARVVDARSQSGGFSPGVAARVRLADGRRAFVKVVSAMTNPTSPPLHRAEARNTAALPTGVPAPRLLGSYDDGTSVALVLQDIDGRQPRIPWIPAELDRVLSAIGELNRTLTPAPVDAPAVADSEAESFTGWRTLRAARDAGQPPTGGLDPWAVRHLDVLAELESGWAGPATGDSLAHGDLRADNILLTDDRVVFVDWPHALRAAPWFDLLLMLPSVAAQGGPDPDTVFTTHPLGRAADPEGVNAVLAALAGYFVAHSLMPHPPGLPTLRAFQGVQGAAALSWLRGRLGRRTP